MDELRFALSTCLTRYLLYYEFALIGPAQRNNFCENIICNLVLFHFVSFFFFFFFFFFIKTKKKYPQDIRRMSLDLAVCCQNLLANDCCPCCVYTTAVDEFNRPGVQRHSPGGALTPLDSGATERPRRKSCGNPHLSIIHESSL